MVRQVVYGRSWPCTAGFFAQRSCTAFGSARVTNPPSDARGTTTNYSCEWNNLLIVLIFLPFMILIRDCSLLVSIVTCGKRSMTWLCVCNAWIFGLRRTDKLQKYDLLLMRKLRSCIPIGIGVRLANEKEDKVLI